MGKICTKCGKEKPITEYSKNGMGGIRSSCKECCNEAHREWYSRNRQHCLDYASKYVEENRDEVLRKKREYNARNADYNSAYRKKWYAKNKDYRMKSYWRNVEKERERGRIYAKKRKTQIRGLRADLSEPNWQDILERFNYACTYCGATGNLHREHFVPLKLGGEYTISNIVPACAACNCSKKAIPPLKWLGIRKYLDIEARMLYA